MKGLREIFFNQIHFWRVGNIPDHRQSTKLQKMVGHSIVYMTFGLNLFLLKLKTENIVVK